MNPDAAAQAEHAASPRELSRPHDLPREERQAAAVHFRAGLGLNTDAAWSEPASLEECEATMRTLHEAITRIEAQLTARGGPRTPPAEREWRRRAVAARAVKLALYRRYKDWRAQYHRTDEYRVRYATPSPGSQAQKATLMARLYALALSLADGVDDLTAEEKGLLDIARDYLTERGQLPAPAVEAAG